MLDLLIENLRLFLLSLLSLAVSFLSFSPFRSSLSDSPASSNEKRAGHKSGATPARDCNLTGYTVLNRVCLVTIYIYVFRPVRREMVCTAIIGSAIDRSFNEKEVADELDKTLC